MTITFQIRNNRDNGIEIFPFHSGYFDGIGNISHHPDDYTISSWIDDEKISYKTMRDRMIMIPVGCKFLSTSDDSRVDFFATFMGGIKVITNAKQNGSLVGVPLILHQDTNIVVRIHPREIFEINLDVILIAIKP